MRSVTGPTLLITVLVCFGGRSHGQTAATPAAPAASVRAAASQPGPTLTEIKPGGTYLQRRAAYKTQLKVKGPAMATWPSEEPPAPARRVTYHSGELELFGWLAMPAETVRRPVPVLVYFHGGLALRQNEFERCRAYLQAGFAVFTPTLRGRRSKSRSKSSSCVATISARSTQR